MELPIMQRLRKELEDLRYELKSKLPKELEAARAHGDLRENAEYEACKERQGYLNARIGQVEQRIRDLSLYSVNSIPQGIAGYGSRVTLESLEGGETQVFEIVFPEEVNATLGKISLSSPMGRALVNKEVGDEVEVQTPRGKKTFQIVDLLTIHEREDLK
ncbi:MAG TPA: transcription elongation factor GreA [Candidatus Binatia bacterium]|nr:transcription elongation factor GreA [Candidatus Binatia bacterium]